MTLLSANLPLAGIRIADLSRVVAGPYGSYLLGRMGATVIRIEDTNPVDSTRDFGPFTDDARSLNRGGYFASLNGGKKSVALHLTDLRQAELARELILSCDAVIENFPAGAMERFGLGYASLSAEKPALVMASVSGFGRTGEMRSYRAYMNTVAAFVGLTSTNGYDGGPPKPLGATFSDYATGTSLALALVLSIRRARSTGRGTYVDLSMAEATMSLMAEPFVDFARTGETAARRGNAFTGYAPAGVYPTRGGDKWIAISISTDVQWQRLVEELSEPGWALEAEFSTNAGRIREARHIDARISEWTRQSDSFELAIRLQGAGIPAFPSSDPEDLGRNPHFAQRGAVAVQAFPQEPGRAMPNLPWHFGRHPGLDDGLPPPPAIGEHNADVLASVTSATAADITSLNEAASRAAMR